MGVGERGALFLVGERGQDRVIVKTKAAQQLVRCRDLHDLRDTQTTRENYIVSSKRTGISSFVRERSNKSAPAFQITFVGSIVFVAPDFSAHSFLREAST